MDLIRFLDIDREKPLTMHKYVHIMNVHMYVSMNASLLTYNKLHATKVHLDILYFSSDHL